MGPPPGWMGGFVPWRLLLVRTSDIYSVITDVEAYPTGVQFTIASRFRPGAVDLHPRPGRPPMMHFGQPDGPRFGVGFADGRKTATGLGLPRPDVDPEGPVLMPRGGGGGGEEWRMGLWLWPLPPPGPLAFVTAWAELGIEETTVTVQAEDLIAAADRAEQLWPVGPDDHQPSGQVSVAGTMIATAVAERAPSPPPDSAA